MAHQFFFRALGVFLIILSACRPAASPEIPPEKMQHVLMDIHFAETWSTFLQRDSNDQKSMLRQEDSLASFYQAVFRHHDITLDAFLQSLDWYKRHPEKMDSIYIRMIPEASALEAVLLGREKKE